MNLGPTVVVGLNDLVSKILTKRGIVSPEAVRAFLDPEWYMPTVPGELPGLDLTVQVLLDAVARGDEICVYGDYDADGVTSTALLVSLLRSLNAKVRYHVPDRFKEGYGMNEGVVRNLASDGVKVILTCDCGISNAHEVKVAKELGLTVLITDHHMLPSELPPADTIVNPQMLPVDHKARGLSGVGVAYMLARGVLESIGQGEKARDFLDLVALGTIADVVPLRGENRYLVQTGLSALKQTKRPGIIELCTLAKLNRDEITEEEIGFQLAPRLNSAGRISSAVLSVELLLEQEYARAGELAAQLNTINQQRRALGEEIFQEAQGMLNLVYGLRPIVLYQPHWHHGIIGIVAGRLAELYRVPVLLMSLKEDGVTVTGSARSVQGIHIYEVLSRCSDFLTKYGGHSGAAGFSLERSKLKLFLKAAGQELELAMESFEPGGAEEPDWEIGLESINTSFYREMRLLAPFGEGNPAPRFCSKQIQVLSQRALSGEKHLRLVLGQGQTTLPAVWWWGGGNQIPPAGDVVYTLSLNRWQGQETLQLLIHELRHSREALTVAEKARTLELVDLRNWQAMGKTLPVSKDAVVYLEGRLERASFPTYNRYTLERAGTLVLLSAPPGLRVLRELLALSGASNLVLAYGEGDNQGAKEFLERLLAISKYIISSSGGAADLKLLVVKTGQLEITVGAGLNFLRAKGLLSLEYVEADRIVLGRGSGAAERGAEEAGVKLKLLLAETRAFRRYLASAFAATIGKLIQGEERSYPETGTPY